MITNPKQLNEWNDEDSSAMICIENYINHKLKEYRGEYNGQTIKIKFDSSALVYLTTNKRARIVAMINMCKQAGWKNASYNNEETTLVLSETNPIATSVYR